MMFSLCAFTEKIHLKSSLANVGIYYKNPFLVEFSNFFNKFVTSKHFNMCLSSIK